MILYTLVALLSFVAGVVMYAKYGINAYADLQKVEASIKDEIAGLRTHVTLAIAKTKVVEADAKKIVTDVKA